MKARLISASCPGFGIRMCLSCKRPWVSSAPDSCREINRTCPSCIAAHEPVLLDWELNPDRAAAEIRIQNALARQGRKLDLSVSQQRRLILADRKARRTA